ncbi:MAG: carbamoyl-phosphate synthase large subunit [Planctomycetota bacterium]|nr:carbamoyl-phosphate synthase large subunit [Planctomycetota bacterium]
MPKREDIRRILILGSGPIVIGQAAEFDYSGTQACKALREEGYEVILVNSNPATIMTDPDMADRTYVEPVTPEMVEKVIERERPDALLPTMGGQTGLNVAMALHENGVLEKYGVVMLGARPDVINKAEDREEFRAAMIKIGLDVPHSVTVTTYEGAMEAREEIGLPCVIRPSFTMGGTGGGIAWNLDEYREICQRGLDLSPTNEILIEQSVVGWKEFELEVMRDVKDNVVIICSIENIDPMGVHTGDSITVAPAQTLTDREYQRMRDAAIRIIREIGVETGGSNIQFAVDPDTGRQTVIEMNPRVSRSSALASKATGFPIAKIAAKLAVGYTLDELANDITQRTKACFEPTIDYVVTKVPRFNFEKFPEAPPILTTQMKSVGEAMAIGRTFRESFQKGLRSLETGRFGFGCDAKEKAQEPQPKEELRRRLQTPGPNRIFRVREALRAGWSVESLHSHTHIDPWFLEQMKLLVDREDSLRSYARLDEVPAEELRAAKQDGYSDHQIGVIFKRTEMEVRAARIAKGIRPVYKLVDTCAGEFEAATPYYYSTYDEEDELRPAKKDRIVILGGGPNRIGQGIEFDYCCVQACFALRDAGYETVMVNSNPETVSTDYDTSDLLFFEPLTVEHVLDLIERTGPKGVIVQYGGQTPLNLARQLEAAGAPIIGTSPEAIDLADDRGRFKDLVERHGLLQTENGIATSYDEAVAVAHTIGYPVLVRPSYVLGGRAMEIVYDDEGLRRYIDEAVEASPEKPILVDRFLEDAVEVDVDAVCDGERCIIGGVMEHIEECGIHSGDSTCTLPAFSLGDRVLDEIRSNTRTLALALGVRGLMNVQYAVKGDRVYLLEVNPRASRTTPFVSKATGVPLARHGACVMAGRTLDELGVPDEVIPPYFSVKEPVFPFNRFPGVDIILGPEMRSTGEVMGADHDLAIAFAKAKLGAFLRLPREGAVFVSVKDSDKRAVIEIARRLAALGYDVVSTSGTHRLLSRSGVPCRKVFKIADGARPNVLDIVKNREVKLIINTPSGRGARTDEGRIRGAASVLNIPCITTISGANALVRALEAYRAGHIEVHALQDLQREALGRAGVPA